MCVVKRFMWVAALLGSVVVLPCACPEVRPCASAQDCREGEACVLGQSGGGYCAPTAPGSEGEGEGEIVLQDQLRVQVTTGVSTMRGGAYQLTGRVVSGSAPAVLRGERFSVRPLIP